MGYYTSFDLTMTPHPEEEKEVAITRDIVALIDCISPEEVRESDIEWFLCDALKWYDYEDHMIEISKKYPDIVFVLHGEGEEHDDIWNEYYCNGECERVDAVITFPEPKNPKFKNLV